MIQKTIIFIVLSCTGGAGYFLGDTDFGKYIPFLNSEFHQIEKKKILPKPKSFYAKRKDDIADSKKQPLSFFLTLNDPSLDKIVGLNGEVITKHHFSPAPVIKVKKKKKIFRKIPAPVSTARIEKAIYKVDVSPVSSPMPKMALAGAGQKNANQISRPIGKMRELRGNNEIRSRLVNNNFPLAGVSAPRKEAEPVKTREQSLLGMISYVVQVSSFRNNQQAEKLKASLWKKGYAAFIGRIELPENKGTWYRVYIGRYFNHAGAEIAAAKFFREENRQAMVIRQAR